MLTLFVRLLGVPLTVLAIGALLTASPAVAGGDGGGGEGPPSDPYANLILGDLWIADKAIVFTGTLTCDKEPTAGHIAMSAAQTDKKGNVVYGAGGIDLKCEPGTVYPIEFSLAPEAGEKFRSGAINVGFTLWADVPGCPDGAICWEQVGFVDWLAEKAK